jgi:hypothetical protein
VKKLLLITILLFIFIVFAVSDDLGITNRFGLMILSNGREGVMGIGANLQFSQGFPIVMGDTESIYPSLSIGYIVEIMGGMYDDIPFYGIMIPVYILFGGAGGVEVKVFSFLNLQLMLGGSYVLDSIDAVFKGRLYFDYSIPNTIAGIHGGFIIDIPFSHELFIGFSAGLSLRY